MQQVQHPLQQEEPRQTPLDKGNQARKPLSKDEILYYVNGTERDQIVPSCMLMSLNTITINFPFQQRWIKTTLKVVVVL
jgi:hypothetical protein